VVNTVNSTPIFSWTALKIAGACLLISTVGPWFLWEVLTIPLGWALRPTLVAAGVLTVGITIGVALRMQGGASDGR
jgi:hypothetical protein